ncbi:GntR family transcriptional regulator [Streptomyces sp. ACT015]|uniref:GntR family transcriptional regulator n=1 Tax=Streptomyces sp. ACT015 TaxID=3134807 RepID=UPI003D166E80
MPAREHIERPTAMYRAVAARVAQDIRDGRYQPGDLLPSEADMVAMYGVGKHTVRSAVAELRTMGLVESRQGKGTIVLGGGALPATVVERSISRTAKGIWGVPQMEQADAPAVSRTTLDGPAGALLDQVDQDAISVDRVLYDPSTGARAAHRTLIPMATTADVPSLAQTPDAEITELYHQLAQAGLTLTFTDRITARTPYPDEQAALRIPDASPLMITYRITSDADTARPLLCEELKTPAALCQLDYPVTPTRAPAARAPRRRTRSA